MGALEGKPSHKRRSELLRVFPAGIYSILGSVLCSDCLLGIFITLLISNHLMIPMKRRSHSLKLLLGAYRGECHWSQGGDAAAQLHLCLGGSLRVTSMVRSWSWSTNRARSWSWFMLTWQENTAGSEDPGSAGRHRRVLWRHRGTRSHASLVRNHLEGSTSCKRAAKKKKKMTPGRAVLVFDR